MTETESLVRSVERWGLLAGVTGVVANLLLIALYALALPGASGFAWTGPANDVMGGIVSTSATIPLALAIQGLLGPASAWPTRLAVAAMVVLALSSLLLVADVVPFETQVFVAVPAIAVMMGWTVAVGLLGGRTGVLPARLAQVGVVTGLAGCAGLLLAGGALLLPAGSLSQYLVGGAGVGAGALGFLVFPVWLVLLSDRLRGHLLAVSVPHSLDAVAPLEPATQRRSR